MLLKVNGVTIPQDAIDREKQFHDDSPDPEHAARCALAIRELLLQRACAVGLASAREALTDAQCEAAIETLCAREAPTPEPTEEECRRYYDSHRSHYRSGDLVEAAHILFAVTPGAPIEAVRRQAESTLKQARQAPERFADLAAALSNCPSGAQGGNLGQLQRGATVPEFESALFEGAQTGVLTELVKTRYGFHVVMVARRIAGRERDFESVYDDVVQTLRRRVQEKAMEQYVRILAAEAQVEGVDLGAATSPLVR
jgi:peptidyl-prolyl cis-trans isomerase C